MQGYQVLIVSCEGRVVAWPDHPDRVDARLWELAWLDVHHQRLREAFVQACMLRNPQTGIRGSIRLGVVEIDFVATLQPIDHGGLVLVRLYPAVDERLTPREQAILRFVAAGDSNAAIASMLDIAESTVRDHLARVREKLGTARCERLLTDAYGITFG